MHHVKEFYLGDLDRLRTSTYDITYDDPGITIDMYKLCLQLIAVCEKLDTQEENQTSYRNLLPYKASILIFLPGLYEIETLYKMIEAWQESDEHRLVVYPLHSSITRSEQEKVFMKPPIGYRKVILSTNIAESSITVPDIKYVIDFCLTKNLCTDTATNCTSLKLEWAAKSNCRQRSGRAGRVMNGRVYRLVDKNFFENTMRDTQVPEILRSPLEHLVLQAKILDLGSPHSILALAMNPPKLSDIGNTILALKETGALLRTVDGRYENFDGDITYLGRVMSALPLDIRTSKLIVLGFIFDVLEESIIIAAGLSVRNIFSTPFNNPMQAYSQKVRWSNGSGSDLLAILNVYTVWQDKKRANFFENANEEEAWAKRYYVQIRALNEMYHLCDEIKDRLKSLEIYTINTPELHTWKRAEKQLVLKIIFCGAFYPYYFFTSPVIERESFHILGGRDPCNTVFFKGFEPEYIGLLYEKHIKNMFAEIAPLKDIKVNFDDNSQRVFVTFTNNGKYHEISPNLVDRMPGRVLTEVYKSIKMRKLKSRTPLLVMNKADAATYAENHGIGIYSAGLWYPKKRARSVYNTVIPPLNVKELKGYIPHVEHCHKFYFQPSICMTSLQLIHDSLKPEVLIPFIDAEEVIIGEVVAAPFYQNEGDADKPQCDSYFRARVLAFNRRERAGAFFDVFYVDYGNTSTVKFIHLRRLDKFVEHLKDTPPCVFPCMLTSIKPSCFDSPQEIWTEEAVNTFREFAGKEEVVCEIYSYVNGIASVYLKKGDEKINDILVQEGFGELTEENYMSKMNHELRTRRHRFSKSSELSLNAYNEDQDEENEEVEPPPIELCRQRVYLSGPHSPLETNCYPIMRYVEYQTATMDNYTVNNIILDTEPQDSRHQFIVAANIGRNRTTNSLIARNTTVMPNIRGFEVIVGLMFCPTMEVNRDSTKTRYSSFLTGLGYDPVTRKPYYDEHDMLFKLDSEITTEDLETVRIKLIGLVLMFLIKIVFFCLQINQIRYSMDNLLHTAPDDDIPALKENSKVLVMNKIKSVLIG